jgi:mono/diheme cytochrome c family protein
LILRARHTTSTRPRIHIIQDMDDQLSYKPQQRNRLFADRRAMRAPVVGTVARGRLEDDAAFYRGLEDDRDPASWVASLPVEIDAPLLRRGRERYDVYCSPCHGLDGYGNGAVSKRAEALQEGTWTPPASFHTDLVRSRSAGHLFNTITNGIRNMPAYGPQVPVADRWAIAAYVQALQRSQHATVDDVPEQYRAALR